ncbi:MAG: diguanylate cyclase [Deinococcota bacterium]
MLRLRSSPISYLLLSFLLAMLLLTLAVVNATFRHTEDLLLNHAQEVMHYLVASHIDNTQRYLEPVAATVRLGQGLMQNGLLDATNDQVLSNYFQQQLRTHAQISGMYLGRDDGSFIFVSRSQTDLQQKRIVTVPTRVVTIQELNSASIPERVEDDFDPRTRPWYRAAQQQSDVVWTDPYQFFTSRQPGISAAIAVTSTEGERLGILGVDIELATISDFLANVPLSPHGHALLQTDDGDIIAYPQYELAQALTNEQPLQNNGLMSITELNTSRIDALRQQTPLLTLRSEDTPVFDTFEVDQQQFYAFVDAFLLGSQTWRVALHAPEADFRGAVQARYQKAVMEIVVIALGLCLLAILVGSMFVRPIYRLQEHATTDPLTGLLNRREFERLGKLQLRKHPGNYALMVFDLDGFKPINDRWGHAVGDEVLRTIAYRAQDAKRLDDLVVRLGGDEFGMLLHVRAADAAKAAKRIRDILQKPIQTTVGEQIVGITAGLAIARVGIDDINTLITQADTALIGGKQLAKNQLYQAWFNKSFKRIT